MFGEALLENTFLKTVDKENVQPSKNNSGINEQNLTEYKICDLYRNNLSLRKLTGQPLVSSIDIDEINRNSQK